MNQLPVLEITRYARRWTGPVTLMVAVASAYALNYHLARIRAKIPRSKITKQTGFALAVMGLYLLEVEPWPVELSGPEDALPAAYANQVLPATDRRAILELPIQAKNGAKSKEMYWQTAHGRPILGGYLSRPFALDYGKTPFVYFLEDERLNQPDFVQTDPATLRALLADYDFGYIAVNKLKIEPGEQERWSKFAANLVGPGTAPFYEDSQLLFYRLESQESTGRPVVLPDTGWDRPEKRPDNSFHRWINQEQATAWLTLPAGLTPVIVKFEAASFFRERNLEVAVNGQKITTLKIPSPLQAFQLEIDSKLLKPGDNLLSFRPLEPPDRPSDHGESRDTRLLGVLIKGLTAGVLKS